MSFRPVALISLLATLALAPGCGGNRVPADAGRLHLTPRVDLRRVLSRFPPVSLEADLAELDETQRQVLDLLVAAAREIDPVYLRQVDARNGEYRRALEAIPGREGRRALAYFDLQYGVYQRQRNWESFVEGVPPRPPGGGFYPTNLERKEWAGFLARHPDREAELISLTTLIERKGDELAGVPYSQAFASHLGSAVKLVLEAARRTGTPDLEAYLVSLADGLENDRYQRADLDWVAMNSPVELTLGPFGKGDDRLFGFKASFEAFVTVRASEREARLSRYERLLPELARGLPGPSRPWKTREESSALRVANLVFSAGGARAGLQTSAFSLPEDEMVRRIRGSKRVLLANAIEAKYHLVLEPLAQRLMSRTQAGRLDSGLFFDLLAFHQLAHGLLPANSEAPVPAGGSRIREELLETFSPIDEARADATGALLLLEMKRRGEVEFEPASLAATYLAELLRSARCCGTVAAGRGASIQLGLLREAGVLDGPGPGGRLRLVDAALGGALRAIVARLTRIEAAGALEQARELIRHHGALPPDLADLMEQANALPLDIRPVFPIAGESR